MDASNLGIMFAPNFLRPKSKDTLVVMSESGHAAAVVSTLISDYPLLFNNKITKTHYDYKTIVIRQFKSELSPNDPEETKNTPEQFVFRIPILLYFVTPRFPPLFQRIKVSPTVLVEDIIQLLISHHELTNHSPVDFNLITYSGKVLLPKSSLEEYGFGIEFTRWHLQVIDTSELKPDCKVKRKRNVLGKRAKSKKRWKQPTSEETSGSDKSEPSTKLLFTKSAENFEQKGTRQLKRKERKVDSNRKTLFIGSEHRSTLHTDEILLEKIPKATDNTIESNISTL